MAILIGPESAFPWIKPDSIPVDLDFPHTTLPDLAVCPVAKQTCDDKVYIQSVVLQNGTLALRAQFNSEIPGLWGREKGGWSHYAIYLEEGGKIYARKAGGPNPSQDGPVQYSLENPRWDGQPERVSQMIIEAVAGWETIQRLRSPSTVAGNPAYALALWLEKNNTEAAKKIPGKLLDAVARKQSAPVDCAVDLDDNSAAGFPPSLGVIGLADNMSNDRLAFRASPYNNDGAALRFHFSSEVNVLELGGASPLDEEKPAMDPPAHGVILAIRQGIRVFSASPDERTPEAFIPETPPERLALILAGALVAVGNQHMPLTQAKAVMGRRTVTTAGEPLPELDHFEPGSALKTFPEMTAAEAAINTPAP